MHVIDMKGKIIAILVSTLMMSSVFAGAENINTNDVKFEPEQVLMEDAKLTIFVDYVTNDYDLGLDELDTWPNPEPEWWYKITVDGGRDRHQEIVHKSDISTFTWDVSETHDFDDCTAVAYVEITIELWDNDDFWLGYVNEQADISARNSDDKKSFKAGYFLETDQLVGIDGDQFENLSDGYYLLNGDLDGTAGHDNDDNDAHMKIRITDNLESLQVTLGIKEQEDLEKNNYNVAPGTELTFTATVIGGLSPFEYRLYPHGILFDDQYVYLLSDSRQVELKYTFLDSYHGIQLYLPFIMVLDSQACGNYDEFEKALVVNNRPNKPSKPTEEWSSGLFRYETVATDPDGDELQYQWEIDGIAKSWNGNNYYESEERASKVRVKVRDDPNIYDEQFGDGLESDWSDYFTKAKSHDRTLFFNLFEMLKARFPCLALFNGFNIWI